MPHHQQHILTEPEVWHVNMAITLTQIRSSLINQISDTNLSVNQAEADDQSTYQSVYQEIEDSHYQTIDRGKSAAYLQPTDTPRQLGDLHATNTPQQDDYYSQIIYDDDVNRIPVIQERSVDNVSSSKCNRSVNTGQHPT